MIQIKKRTKKGKDDEKIERYILQLNLDRDCKIECVVGTGKNDDGKNERIVFAKDVSGKTIDKTLNISFLTRESAERFCKLNGIKVSSIATDIKIPNKKDLSSADQIAFPIGKRHGGDALVDVVDQDPDYVAWVLSQNWMVKRFPNLCKYLDYKMHE